MTTIYLLLLTVFLNVGTPTDLIDTEKPQATACCGDDGILYPPPPPDNGK